MGLVKPGFNRVGVYNEAPSSHPRTWMQATRTPTVDKVVHTGRLNISRDIYNQAVTLHTVSAGHFYHQASLSATLLSAEQLFFSATFSKISKAK